MFIRNKERYMSKLHNYVQDYVTKASKDINGVVNSEKANKLKKKLLLISGIGSAITVLLFGIGSLMIDRKSVV